MAIQMTRAEYEAKYGQAPNAAPTSTQPIQMTRAEYQAKYGSSGAPQPPTGYKDNSVTQDFAKAIVDPLTKIGSSVSKALLPKALEPQAIRGTSVPSVFGGKDVNLVGYRDGQKLQGKELAKDIAGTALEGASYLPITSGASAVVKGVGGVGPKIGKLAKDFGIAGALQGAGSELQRGGGTGETLTEGIKMGLTSMVAGPVIGKGLEAVAKPVANVVKKATDPVKFYTNQAKTNALKAVNVIGGVKPADMSKIKDKAYRALSVISNVAPDIKIRRGDELVPFDIKNTETPYLDTNDAIVEARKKVYEGIRGAYQEATGQKLAIDPTGILDDLRAIYNSPANAIEKRAKAQSLRDEILGMTDKNGFVPIENIETFTPQLNARAKPGFGNSSALGAQLDKDFSIKLSTLVDDAVEKIGIPQLRDLKDDYSALKAVEKFILNEAKKEARRLDTSLAANIGDVGSAEILSGIVNAFRAASGDAQAATSLARGVGLKVMSTMRKAAGDRANFLRNAFDDIEMIQKSSPQKSQITKPTANMPAIQGATAQSIKNSNSGTTPRSLPLTADNASYTPEDMRLAEDFLNSQPNASIAADQAKAKELLSGLQAQLESLDAMDSMKGLGKFVGKRGEFKGELNLNNGSGRFGREGDTILREAVPGSEGKSAEELAGKYSSWANARQSVKENIDSLKKFLRQSPRGMIDFDAKIGSNAAVLGAVGLGASAAGNQNAGAMNTQNMPLLGSPEEEKEPFMRPGRLVEKPSGVYSPRRGLEVTEDDLAELEAILFGEVANKPLDKKLTEARTIANIVLNRAEASGKTVKEVLREPNQFQAYLGKEYKKYKSGEAEKNVVSRKKVEAIRKVVEELRKGQFKNTVGDNLSYAHLKDDTLRLYKDWSEQKKDLKNIK